MEIQEIKSAIEARDQAALARIAVVEGALTKAQGEAKAAEARLFEIEQRMVRAGGHGPTPPQSWGTRFANSPEVKTFAENTTRPARVRLEMKTTITSATGSGGDLVVPDRDATNTTPMRRLTVRNLLPVIRVSGGSVEYPRQTTRTNNAATVAEAAAKPESAYAWELVSTPIRTIAHWVPASRQVLDDAPQLAGIIDSELLYGLRYAEELQLLLGGGTGTDLNGLYTQATAFSTPFTIAAPTILDVIGLAILQAALADFPPDGIVMHSSDWMRMRLLKDADGNYILGAPGASVEPRLFGLPVVATPAMTIDKFLVGAFQAAGTIYDRWDARVEVSTEHSDFFTKNLVAILAEERLGLAVKRTAALVKGDFSDAVTAATTP